MHFKFKLGRQQPPSKKKKKKKPVKRKDETSLSNRPEERVASRAKQRGRKTDGGGEKSDWRPV